jgi:hypothetical protein
MILATAVRSSGDGRPTRWQPAVDRQSGRAAAKEFLRHTNPRTTDGYLRDKNVTMITPLVRKRM